MATHRSGTVLGRARHYLAALRLGHPATVNHPNGVVRWRRLAQGPAAMLHRPFRLPRGEDGEADKRGLSHAGSWAGLSRSGPQPRDDLLPWISDAIGGC